MQIKEIIASITDTEIEQNTKFWRAVVPTTIEQIQNCYIFAFLSIRSSWRQNVKGFDLWGHGKILKIANAVLATPDDDPTRDAKFAALEAMVEAARSGLEENRTKGVISLADASKNNPNLLLKQEGQTWEKYRRSLIKNIFFLGMAKSSFVSELLYPETSEIVCFDVQMHKMLGMQHLTIGKRRYRELEKEWVSECKDRGVAPAIARHIVWSRELPSGNCSDWANSLDFTGVAAKEAFN